MVRPGLVSIRVSIFGVYILILMVFLVRPISQGEELFLEYGENYWRPKDRKAEGRGRKATTEPARRNSESDSMIVDDESA